MTGSGVLHVIPYMAAAAGGPPIVVRRLVEGAPAMGWSPQVITSQDHADGLEETSAFQSEAIVFSSQLAALTGKGKATLEAAVARARLIHCHTIWSPMVTAAAACAHRYRVPYILSPHGMLDPYSIGQKRLKKRLYWSAFERRTIRDASCVLFTTEQERLLAEQSVGPVPNPQVVALGADQIEGDPVTLRAQFFAAHPDLAARPILLFLGRLHPKKRPEALVAAMKDIVAQFPTAILVFAGSGDQDFRETLERQADAFDVRENVRFLGHVGGSAKSALLAAADLFLLPSHQENFAIAAAEALHAGLPVLLTRKVNIWQEIVDANAGLALAEDGLISEIASGVITLLRDPDRRQQMSENAVGLARRAFTWEQCRRNTYRIYEDIVSQAGVVDAPR